MDRCVAALISGLHIMSRFKHVLLVLVRPCMYHALSSCPVCAPPNQHLHCCLSQGLWHWLSQIVFACDSCVLVIVGTLDSCLYCPHLQLCNECEHSARDQKLCPQGVSEEVCMFCQVAQAAIQVWAKGSRAAEVLVDTSVQEKINLEAALRDGLLPHLSKMSAEVFQVRLLLCQNNKSAYVHCQDHQCFTNALAAQSK